jgi:hypothetical protein
MSKHRQCFASWCQGARVSDLNPEIVSWLKHVMASPEMRGISSLDDLSKALKLRRTKLRFPDPLSWNRAWLLAKAMWFEWKNGGRV